MTQIDLHIFQDDSVSTDLIIGRDFITIHKEVLVNVLEALINTPEKNSQNKMELLSEVASVEIMDTINENSKYTDLSLENFATDFETNTSQQLKTVIDEVNNTSVPPPDEEYLVEVTLKDSSIFAFAPRRFAFEERRQIREITDDLLKREIIKPSISPYCARVVPVRKRNGSMRLCVDLRPLNERVVKQKYPFPLIEDCLARIGDKSIFTLLDLKDGFHQIKIHPEHTRYFSFATLDGKYEYTRLPFGYSEAPAEFQKRLVQILQPLIRKDSIIVYMDDILIPTNTILDNLQIIKKVLLLLKQYEFQLNWGKCLFLRKSVEYLGYVLSPTGITISPRHIEAIKKFPIPKKMVEVQRFLGLTNYFRKFIKDYASKARPMSDLLRKSSKFDFNENCIKAFKNLKEELMIFPVLRLYNPQFKTELHTDASNLALAGILLQRQSTNHWAPVAYYSQATNKAEMNYHSFELEMLAVVKAIERFHIYLYGIEFTVVTDCHALVFAINKAHLNPRIARWTLRLQNYKFKILHRAGRQMVHVDALSRIVAHIETMPLEKELEYKQLQDQKLKSISEDLEFSNNDKFTLINGLVYKKGPDKPRFAVPEAMVNNIVRIYHDNMAHCGVEKTIQGINDNYWFPSMRKRVVDHVDNCITCLLNNVSSNTREGELQETNSPSSPFQILHTDHYGPMVTSINGFKHVLVVIDACTRFTWLFPVKSTSSKETIKYMTLLFQIFGSPQQLVSDRGTSFTSLEFSKFLESNNISHRLVAVAAPWANGLVERINRFLKSSLKKIVSDQQLWDTHLSTVQYVINNSFHSSLKSSPAKLLLGFDQRCHADNKLVDFLNKTADIELNPVSERDSSREIALQATDRIKNYNKMYYDERHKKPSQYKKGDLVMIRDTNLKPGEDRKLKYIYKGPYQVDKVLNKNRYAIKDIPGFNPESRPYNSILSPDRLKLWIRPVQNNNDKKTD